MEINMLTLKQIEEKYGIKADTIRSYINRGQVIPEDKRVKIGNQWFVDSKFADDKWGKKTP